MHLSKRSAVKFIALCLLFAAFRQILPAKEAASWQPPEAWALKKINGTDFHFQFEFYLKQLTLSPPVYTGTLLPGYLQELEKYPENIQRLSAMDCFQDIQYHFYLREDKQADGTYTFPLKSLPLDLQRVRGKPFIIDCFSTPGLAQIYYLAHFRHDQQAYREWLKEHPDFLGFMTCEWGNDALILHQPSRHGAILPGSSRFAITKQDIDRLIAEQYPHTKNRDEHISILLKKTYSRISEYCFNDPSKLWIGEGHWCIGHLPAYWGAGAIGIETTRNYMFWQNQLMFCRGAARQFRIPWYWWIATYFEGYDSKGNRTAKGTLFSENSPRLEFHGPDYGISLSSVKRAFYLAWLSGAAFAEREAVENCFFLHRREPEKQELSEEGLMYVDFYRFFRKHTDRGISYTPIALLVPANRGYCRFGGKAFSLYDYTQPDFMLDAVMSSILDYPKNRLLENMRNGVECVMANQPYGDIFDAITPDFEDQSSFRHALPNYRAAFLIGDYGDNPAMVKILTDYVQNGGTLIMNIRQLNQNFPADFAGFLSDGTVIRKGAYQIEKVKLQGARNIRTAEDGSISFTMNNYGKGRVIVGLQHWLTPWYGDDEAGQQAALQTTTMGTPIRFPEIEWLLKTLSAEYLPLKVSGNIQYGLNRTLDGWLLYLINNAGVTKFADKPQVLDPKGEDVQIELGTMPAKQVFELLTEQKLECKNGTVQINVPSGDVRILKIQ